jgi:hypothetical protein
MGSRLYLVAILGQYTYMYKVYLVMVHSHQVVHMNKMNRYNIYISIFIYGDETLNINICKCRYILLHIRIHLRIPRNEIC